MSPRWLIVILVWAMARLPCTSTADPPRKCRMLTPFSKPALLTSMNFAAGPWNQVADIQPSSCHTVRKRSQSPASRHSAQFCTTSMIACLSALCSSIARPSIDLGAGELDDLLPLHDVRAQELVELVDRHAHGLRALPGPALLHVGLREHLVDFRIQLFQDGPRRAGRRHEAEPDRRLVARHAGLGDGRHVGRDR